MRAPFAGRVADLKAVEGAYVGNGSEALTLLQLDPIATVPPAQPLVLCSRLGDPRPPNQCKSALLAGSSRR